MARSLRVYGGGVSFQVVSGQSSCLTRIWPDSGPFLVVCTSLSQDRFQHEGFWQVGRTYYELASPPSFRPLPNSSGWFWWQLVSSVFLVGTSCFETTYTSAQGEQFRSTVP